MASKLQKVRSPKKARGRPKLENVAREPNGRVSRSPLASNSNEIGRRADRLGLSADQARDQKAATFIGYLNILGKHDGISNNQYDAALKYMDLRRSYHLAIKAPNAERSDEGTGCHSQEISDSYIDWCRNTIDRHDECRKAIQQAQNQSRCNLWAALDLCFIRDERMLHMIGDIRLLCNALIMFFRV